jgi:hypothetical protein
MSDSRVMPAHEPPGGRWYRHRWPWILLALPLAAVVASVITAVLAVRGADSLVSEDYYRRGLTVNRDLARAARARSLGLTIEMRMDSDRTVLSIDVAGGSATELPAVLQVSLLDPVQAGFDRHVEARAVTPGHYEVRVQGLPKRRWHVVVESATWRMVGRWRDNETTRLDAG